MYTYIHSHRFTHKHTHIDTYIHNKHTYIHTCAYTYKQTHTHTHTLPYLQGCFWLGAALWAAVYGGVFSATDDVGGYFLMMTGVVGVSNLVAMATLSSQPPEYSHVSEQELSILATTPPEDTQDSVAPEYIDDMKGLRIFKNLDYHLIVWPFVICAGIELTFIFNLTTFLRSFRIEGQNVLLTVIGPLMGSASKVYNGLVSDWTGRRVPRATYLLLANGLQLLALVLFAVAGDRLVVVVLATLLVYNANGANMSVVPSIIGELLPDSVFTFFTGSKVRADQSDPAPGKSRVLDSTLSGSFQVWSLTGGTSTN